MQLISIKELRRQKIPRSTLQMRDVIKKKKNVSTFQWNNKFKQ